MCIELFQIVSYAHTEKHLQSSQLQLITWKHVAFHWSLIERLLVFQEMCQNVIKNADETYFINNEENEHMLDFICKVKSNMVTCAKFVAGRKNTKNFVRVSSGWDEKTHSLLMILKCIRRYYPVCNIPNIVVGVSTTRLKNWIDITAILQHLSKPRSLCFAKRLTKDFSRWCLHWKY